LSDCYLLLGEYTSARPAEILPKARPHAYRALELDGALAEAHASLGLISIYDYDWATAEREFKRAIELRSGYATAHHWYAILLVTLGRFAEARAEAERALELDPASVIVLHGMLGDSDRAFALLEQAYAERDWMLRDVKVSPLWDSLRKDPRFPKLLQQMHLD